MSKQSDIVAYTPEAVRTTLDKIFDEIDQGFSAAQTKHEALRCLRCDLEEQE